MFVVVGFLLVYSGIWQKDISPLLTTFGVGSLVLGLALQDTLGNLFAGLSLVFERPIAVGDWIQVGDQIGRVQQINWRSTRIVTRELTEITVPNSTIGKERLHNFSNPSRVHGFKVSCGFSYDAPPNTVKEIDASSGEIFHTLSFIVSMAAGFIIFGETCSLQKALGTVVIIAGILFEARSAKLTANYGVAYKLASALFTAAAIIVTKHLTSTTPPTMIVLSGFLVPGVIYLLIGWREIPAILPTITASRGSIVAVPVFELAAYAAAVAAFAIGEFSTTYIVFQTTITAVLVLEIALYGWQHRIHLNRTISAGLCALGAVVAIVG